MYLILELISPIFPIEEILVECSLTQDQGSNGSTQVLFIIFLLMVSIIVSNLIVGLTVNKTEELFKEAGVIRLEKTVLQVRERKMTTLVLHVQALT